MLHLRLALRCFGIDTTIEKLLEASFPDLLAHHCISGGVVLGLVVEIVSGRPWTEYIRTRIFAPLGMQDSYTSFEEAKAHGMTAMYCYWFGVPVEAEPVYLPGLAPTGYLVSTANNMARYLSMYLLGGAIAVRAWAAIDPERLAPMSRHADRTFGAILIGLGALLTLRYLPGLIDIIGGEPTLPEYLANPTSCFLITTMDLDIVAPTTMTAGIAIMGGAGWARKALYAIVGWFALVGTAVAAMATAMVLHEDSHAAAGQMLGFIAAAAVLDAFAVRLYWPHVGRHP